MKKLFLFLLLVPLNSHAEWTQVEDSFDGISTYVDLSSIRKTGSLRRIWALFDFSKPQEDSKYLSMKSLSEYDCKTEKYRVLSNTIFRGNMGSGEVINAPEPDRSWQYISPESKAEFFYKLVCKRR